MHDLDSLPDQLIEIADHFDELRRLVTTSSHRHEIFSNYSASAIQASRYIQNRIDRVKEERLAYSQGDEAPA